jgi:glycosyltransferase involved in cell wall biosynthesis
MKILVVQDYLRSGGTERQSVLLSNAFAAAGHATTLLTFRPGGALKDTVAPVVVRVELQPTDRQLDWFAPGLLKAVCTSAPDIVVCMGRMANCYAGSMQQALLRCSAKSAVIATMRTGKPLPFLFRRSLRLSQHVVANSQAARAKLVRSHGVPEEKISVIYNSLVFPPEAALARNEVLRQQYGARSTTMVMLCVAMFRPEKNQRELIEIAATLPAHIDWQLWLAGDGPARAACEQLAAERNLGARVKFPGFLRDPSPLYAAGDVAVHASGSESLSNFLIEAQAHGLPAVAYDAQGISETFVQDRTGWCIQRGDRSSFCAALERLACSTPADAAIRAAQARAYARDTFETAAQVRAYLELFSRLT